MKIISATYIISNTDIKKCPAPNLPEYAFIGRSNVGKSSLINLLTDKKNLAKISGTPGKTKLINHFEIINSIKNKTNKWYLVDLPGYGYATVAKNDRKEFSKMIETYIKERNNLVNLFVLIDGRHKPQQIDLDFIAKLGLWQAPFSLVFTKIDKVKPQALKNNIDLFLNQLLTQWETLPQYFTTSIINKNGAQEILKFIDNTNKSIELTN